VPYFKSDPNFLNLHIHERDAVLACGVKFWVKSKWNSLDNSNGIMIAKRHIVKLKLSIEQKLTIMPDELRHLTHLEELSFRHTFIKQIPDIFNCLSRLTFLDLSSNSIESLPLSLWNLKSLIHLNIEGNDISLISRKIAKLKRLEFLGLSGNPLDTFPKGIGSLTQLKKLTLPQGIRMFPPSFNNLEKLKYIIDIKLDHARVPKYKRNKVFQSIWEDYWIRRERENSEEIAEMMSEYFEDKTPWH